MPTDFVSAGQILSARARGPSDELRQACLLLMRQLEASLHGSRKALLALDLVSIERETREQVGLIVGLDTVRQQALTPPASGIRPPKNGAPENGGEPELGEELRQSAHRILSAARLQAALLMRARSKLHVLANMLAGTSVDYGPLLAKSGVPQRVFVSSIKHEAEGSDPCRA
jgi:hypothetical protein